MQGSYEALKVEIDHVKEDIKEIKEDNKEMKIYYRDVINELKENSIQQTMILNNQERQFSQVNNDIAELKEDFENNVQSQTIWYQDFLSTNFGMVFKVMIILILALSGVKLAGFDVSKLLGL